MKALIIALALAPLDATVAAAGPIGSACNNSSRNGANPRICACIQQVADRTLDHAAQRRPACFFRDPQRAHVDHGFRQFLLAALYELRSGRRLALLGLNRPPSGRPGHVPRSSANDVPLG